MQATTAAKRISAVKAVADAYRETPSGIIYFSKGASTFSMHRDGDGMAEIIGKDSASQETARHYYPSFRSFLASVVGAAA